MTIKIFGSYNKTCCARLKTANLLATAKQLIRRPPCCLKNQAISFTERTSR